MSHYDTHGMEFMALGHCVDCHYLVFEGDGNFGGHRNEELRHHDCDNIKMWCKKGMHLYTASVTTNHVKFGVHLTTDSCPTCK